MPNFNINMTGRSAGDEISSTYEGRHITALESAITHPTRDSGFVNGGDPVLVGDIIVGVALKTASAATDNITIDTEGIWALTVQAKDDLGNVAVAEGDQIYINTTTCVLSKLMNKATQRRFGYAMSPAVSGTTTTVVAVKVHFDPVDAEEIVGNGTAQMTSATANKIWRHYRYTSSATSGDARAQYTRLTLTGIGGGGEAARLFTTVSNVAGVTARGAHISLDFGTTGTISGLGAAVDATLHIPNAAMAANGTYAAISADLHAVGATTDPAAVTELSFFRVSMQGNATGMGAIDDKALLFDFDGPAVGAGNMIFTNAALAATHLIRCTLNGVAFYIMATDTPA